MTIAGKYVKGAALTDGSATWGQKLAGAGYQQVRDAAALRSRHASRLGPGLGLGLGPAYPLSTGI